MSIDKYLGKTSTYQTKERDASLLVGEARQQITDKFDTGYDVWHCYETTFLVNDGMGGSRVSGITKIRFNVLKNPNLVESKSLKLYMFSHADTMYVTEDAFCWQVRCDLVNVTGPDVVVNFFPVGTTVVYDDVSGYSCNPHLRSNCKVTGQPDFGDLYTYADTRIVSDFARLDELAHENHFHEECVELIFDRLASASHPDNALEVFAKYTRRGGIDIWPYRSKGLIMTRPEFLRMDILTNKTFRG